MLGHRSDGQVVGVAEIGRVDDQGFGKRVGAGFKGEGDGAGEAAGGNLLQQRVQCRIRMVGSGGVSDDNVVLGAACRSAVGADGGRFATGVAQEVSRHAGVRHNAERGRVVKFQPFGRIGEDRSQREAGLVAQEGHQVGKGGDGGAVLIGVGAAAIHEMEVVVFGNNLSGRNGAGRDVHHMLVLVVEGNQLVAGQMDVAGVIDAQHVHGLVVVGIGGSVGGACVIDAVEPDIRLHFGEGEDTARTGVVLGVGAAVVSEDDVVGDEDAA